MRVLCDYGLAESGSTLQEHVESRGYSIHTCVHLWTIHVLNRDWDRNLAKFAVQATGRHVPGGNAKRPWVTQRRLLQHVDKCYDYIEKGIVVVAGIEDALHSLGSLYRSQGKLAEAGQMYQRALQGYEKALGAEHTKTVQVASRLHTLRL